MATDRQQVTEESGEHKAWFVEADKIQTVDEAAAFAKRLMDDYEHDYGTICHAMAAGALAIVNGMNRHERGGITGFQASFVMWGFVQHWLHMKDEPLRLVKFREMLYPQYEDTFGKAISPKVWNYLQAEARKHLSGGEQASPSVVAHWRSIADGKVPFGYEVRDNA